VSITAPQGGTVFAETVNIMVEVIAEDSDGSIVKVIFSVDDAMLREDLEAPYEFVWQAIGEGDHLIQVVAWDDSNITATASVSIKVGHTIRTNGGGGPYIPTLQDLLTKLVGLEIQMDFQITSKVLHDEPGKKYYFDASNDSFIDTIYLIDNDERHGDTSQPLLIKIVD